MNTYIFIPGGEAFSRESEYQYFITSTLVDWNKEPFSVKEEKRKWKSELATKLTETGNLVYMPNFPNPINARYNEWKIFFETWIEHIEIEGRLTLIGHSLGGNFLLKYFSEVPVIATQEAIQVSEKSEHGLLRPSQGRTPVNLLFIDQIHLVASCISEGDFATPENYATLRSLGAKVHIWHAEDDTVVPFGTAKELEKELPEAITHYFGNEKGYGHFYPLAVFPEFEDILIPK